MNPFCSDKLANCLIAENAFKTNECIREAEKIVRQMLGCTLVTINGRYILSMLELYYGGVGDPLHDWYRARNGSTERKTHVQVIFDDGLKVYLKSPKAKDSYRRQRMDIVIGPKSVPISILIRNVIDEKTRQPVGYKKDGNRQ